MIDNTNLDALCQIADTHQEFRNQIKLLINRAFTLEMKSLRNQQLESLNPEKSIKILKDLLSQ